jgi:hypothetical protein
MRLLLRFVAEEGEDDQDEDDIAENTAEWGAFGFMFVLGVLSFAEARPSDSQEAILVRAPRFLSPVMHQFPESFRDPNFERRNATVPFCGQEPKILP